MNQNHIYLDFLFQKHIVFFILILSTQMQRKIICLIIIFSYIFASKQYYKSSNDIKRETKNNDFRKPIIVKENRKGKGGIKNLEVYVKNFDFLSTRINMSNVNTQ
ncbi:hypothetical protein H311_00239 [Anncaliia algerae PRA109]|nr:hypothetical protein H311_00239 [Anncaliia algerae PRA109]